MIENGMVAGYGFEETTRTPKKIATCKYIYCDEEIYDKDGFEFGGYLYCSTGCVAEQLLEENDIVDLSA